MKNYFFIIFSLSLFLSACSATLSSFEKGGLIQNEGQERNIVMPDKEKTELPDWLIPPPEGSLVTQVITIYEHPVTKEQYQTNTGGYTILVK
jgi:hypothetical protein